MSSSVNKDKDIYLGAIKASWVNPGQLGQEVPVLACPVHGLVPVS